ncbi:MULTISPECIES: Dam family site-specific DNA-(adenine-N6)-methyltransferase [Vibrio]|jgi:DNA adenine methylase|uniref:Site-specific DNA-methyltransferase (adenine-specific) n=1 Tax=Vibrio natriegens NBRC 15636 = ATCC 14048 = DSM 759 TaxID=1219067 RepID=A0AAN0Y483_VIBNA|nr:Dam family site-specific DNA-(adenine-N6)-methyltransferase [Vibrio natriegens]MEE3880786.1 Dam family site-specific DNA-(adenine-N6)-methyltransferase [Vibrio sp. YYF0003]ALR17151.1 DNA adenine methylase [Vibrio natriegens NBRC 15636 = ATCC 14048 = DSM 759]ANQ13651.1 DNA adenine methylase [Vibrio natriegens NBRC 15636 = ATCC 14048 = DSM 759]ANQ18149.1 DNA adenine methylase [Vibrio natriegens]EPM40546.1 DNA adenine methylase [Vibrio natriegens NBRC 15636 = ATCC 14048 = DSM 759]
MKKQRAFLKWAGGKYGLVEDIQRHLPPARKLVEPFVGAGSVFLNTDYDQYLLADINPDLINLYNLIKARPEEYISEAKRWFVAENNRKEAYLSIRAEFNKTDDVMYRSLAFLYMNRFGFNGLCRYNKKGGFNVPFGSYKKPYFPEAELEFFAEKAKKATFVCEGYPETFRRARKGSVVYCDPPYAPLSNTANFTSYAGNGFTLDDQAALADIAERTATERGIPVLISNHDTTLTRRLYHGADLSVVKVKRTISRNGSGRNKVDELLALFNTPDSDSAAS